MRSAIGFWLQRAEMKVDQIITEYGPEDRDVTGTVVGILQDTLCRVLGHHPVMDHCGMPEHDFCVFCNALTPYAAHKEGAR